MSPDYTWILLIFWPKDSFQQGVSQINYHCINKYQRYLRQAKQSTENKTGLFPLKSVIQNTKSQLSPVTLFVEFQNVVSLFKEYHQTLLTIAKDQHVLDILMPL